jgi:hypothetical protein
MLLSPRETDGSREFVLDHESEDDGTRPASALYAEGSARTATGHGGDAHRYQGALEKNGLTANEIDEMFIDGVSGT